MATTTEAPDRPTIQGFRHDFHFTIEYIWLCQDPHDCWEVSMLGNLGPRLFAAFDDCFAANMYV